MAILGYDNTGDSAMKEIVEEKESPELQKISTISNVLKGKLSIRSVRTSGPGGVFNPTNIRMRVRWQNSIDSTGSISDVALIWRSRDNRKGRNSIAVSRKSSLHPSISFPDGRPGVSSGYREVFRGIKHMFTTFPYWDLAFWVALCFNIGSMIWIANGLFEWLPVAYPETAFPGEATWCYSITSLVGVVVYILGAGLAYLEAVNYGSLYGSVLRRIIEGEKDYPKRLVDEKLASFFNNVVPTSVRKREKSLVIDPEEGWWNMMEHHERRRALKLPLTSAARRGAVDLGPAEGEISGYSTFRWWPTCQNFREQHIHEIGFLACAVQLVGAILFIIPGVVSLPVIYDQLQPWTKNVTYWMPDIVASLLFVPSSLLFTLETQERWYRPQMRVLGWWIGFWALLGSIGFVISGAFGPPAENNHVAAYHTSLACLWGSVCFWISSLLQQFEAANKRVVEELEDSGAQDDSFDTQIESQ